jgi:hypothetical protein
MGGSGQDVPAGAGPASAPKPPSPSTPESPALAGYRQALTALRVPINHPAWSGGMLVLVKGSAESVSSADLQVSGASWQADRIG